MFSKHSSAAVSTLPCLSSLINRDISQFRTHIDDCQVGTTLEVLFQQRQLSGGRVNRAGTSSDFYL